MAGQDFFRGDYPRDAGTQCSPLIELSGKRSAFQKRVIECIRQMARKIQPPPYRHGEAVRRGSPLYFYRITSTSDPTDHPPRPLACGERAERRHRFMERGQSSTLDSYCSWVAPLLFQILVLLAAHVPELERTPLGVFCAMTMIQNFNPDYAIGYENGGA
jgi:hypothetical protein